MSLTRPAPTPRAHRTPRSRTTQTRRGGGHRTSSVIVAAALLTMWGVHALGWHFAVVLSMLAAAAAAALLIRHRPDIAVSITIAALTAAAPMAVLIADVDNGRPLTEVTPLLMFAIGGPLPTLLAWTCRPVISRPLNAAIGSLILLTGAAAQWALGADAGVLQVALLTAATVIYLRYHRARRLTQRFTTDDDGWTDLGGRALHQGLTAQLLIGHGRAIAVYRPAPGDLSAGQLQQVVAAAVPLARALRLPPSRVQPMVLHPRPGTQWHRELVNDGVTATYLPIGDSDALPGVRAAAFTAHHHPAHVGLGASLERAAHRWVDGRLVDRAAAVLPAVS